MVIFGNHCGYAEIGHADDEEAAQQAKADTQSAVKCAQSRAFNGGGNKMAANGEDDEAGKKHDEHGAAGDRPINGDIAGQHWLERRAEENGGIARHNPADNGQHFFGETANKRQRG